MYLKTDFECTHHKTNFKKTDTLIILSWSSPNTHINQNIMLCLINMYYYMVIKKLKKNDHRWTTENISKYTAKPIQNKGRCRLLFNWKYKLWEVIRGIKK